MLKNKIPLPKTLNSFKLPRVYIKSIGNTLLRFTDTILYMELFFIINTSPLSLYYHTPIQNSQQIIWILVKQSTGNILRQFFLNTGKMIRDKDHMSLTQFGLIWGLFITFHFGLIFNDLDYFQFWTEFRSFGLISKKQSEFEK